MLSKGAAAEGFFRSNRSVGSVSSFAPSFLVTIPSMPSAFYTIHSGVGFTPLFRDSAFEVAWYCVHDPKTPGSG